MYYRCVLSTTMYQRWLDHLLTYGQFYYCSLYYFHLLHVSLTLFSLFLSLRALSSFTVLCVIWMSNSQRIRQRNHYHGHRVGGRGWRGFHTLRPHGVMLQVRHVSTISMLSFFPFWHPIFEPKSSNWLKFLLKIGASQHCPSTTHPTPSAKCSRATATPTVHTLASI